MEYTFDLSKILFTFILAIIIIIGVINTLCICGDQITSSSRFSSSHQQLPYYYSFPNSEITEYLHYTLKEYYNTYSQFLEPS